MSQTTPSAAAHPVPPPAGRAPRRAWRRSTREALGAYAFVAPFMILFVALLVIPLGYAGYLSLFREQLVGGNVFAGLANYRQALDDPLFRDGVLRMARFLVVQVPVMLGAALFFALVLDSGRLRFARLIRLGIFIPYAIPSVIAALMWGYLYGPDFGPFAQLARGVGLDAPGFLTPDWILASLGNIVTWEFIGYNMIILFAALQSVPATLYEAAAVDGAGAWRVAWHIKIPAIRQALLLCVIFSVIGTFQLFNEPKLLSTIAPDAISTSYTPNMYAYTLVFTNQEVNYSSAVSFLLGAVIVVVSYAVQLASHRRIRRS
ncbi:sugar ABC transporter permease [Streptomyces sp. NBC_00554]|uniref:carbohydrate ABC transporter permease n=1 Tax=Streptomyces sp. NBC_00554 TaxID=2903661 RepID=UPI00352D0D88|nr:sugar ABC transporter permease [Streptomyces sp. NBC_00554]